MTQPKAETKAYAALGRMSMAYRVLEHVVQRAIGVLLDLEPSDDRMLIITNKIRLSSLAPLMYKLARHRWKNHADSEELRGRFKQLQMDLAKVAEERNKLVHSIIVPTDFGGLLRLDDRAIIEAAGEPVDVPLTMTADIEDLIQRMQHLEGRVVLEVIVRVLRERDHGAAPG